MSKQKAAFEYGVNRREDQAAAWYAGADAVLEAAMKAAQKAIDRADPKDKDAIHQASLLVYKAAEEAFTRCPFRQGPNAKPPVLPAPAVVPAPTV